MRFDRRGFFSFALAGVASACLAPFLPKRNPAPGLKFHKDAFGSVFDPDSGISMRFIQSFDANQAQRVDVIYGYMVKPELACRIVEP